MQKKDEEIVVLHQFDNVIEANIAKTKLDAYGIPCFLTGENMANLYPGQMLHVFRVRLHLFACDRDRAIQILEKESLMVRHDASATCPKCHSHLISRAFPRRIADSFLVVFFGIFFPHRKVSLCRNCGHEF